MAILYACQSPTCPEREFVVGYLVSAPAQPQCDTCGAPLDALEADDDREAA